MKTKFLSGTLSFFMFFSLAYAVSSSLFLFAKEANAQAPSSVCDASIFSGGLVQCGKGNDPLTCNFEAFICLLRRIMNFLLFVLAVPAAAISFAWAGWLYMSAAGNEGKIKQAHEIFGTVLLGLCLALAAWLIVHAIVKGLGVDEKYNFLGN